MIPTSFSPLPVGAEIDLGGLRLMLGPVDELDFPGFSREARSDDGQRFRLLELPPGGAAALEGAFTVAGVAVPSARRLDSQRDLLALRPPSGPSLDWVLDRGEGLALWDLRLIDGLADLFQAIHDAGLVFRRIAPEMFCVAPDGSVTLEQPELLRRPGEPASRPASVFTAPEILGGATGDARSDQYGLGVLAWSLITGRTPLQRGVLPLPRIFRPQLPHGAFATITRATRVVAGDRYPSCRDFAADLRRRTAPRGASPGAISLGAASELGRLKGQHMPVNQDAWYFGFDAASGRAMLLVADGVSTADVGSGDIASTMLRDAVRDAWEGPVGDILRGHEGTVPSDWARAALEAILDDANARIYAFLKQPIFVGSLTPTTHPPGSTAVLGILDDDRLTVANVGDSRLYLLRDGALEQMTVDHDVRSELLKAGRDPRSVSDPGSLGALTHSVGSFCFDNEGGVVHRPVGADLLTLHLRAGDRLLLCSDGVPDCMGEDHEHIIARELGLGTDPEAIARQLCRLADEAIGADNITALVVLAQ